VRRIAFSLAVVFLAVSSLTIQAQETEPASPSLPVAVRSQSDCSGFIADTPVPHDLYVVGGGDDDFHSVVRQFGEGEWIYFSPSKGGNVAVGAEFSVVRPANELFLTMHYQGQRGDIGRLGQPYEDVGKVRVTHVNPEGAVAKVTFSCGSIVAGDTLVPFQPRAIPEYTVSKPLDHFAPLDNNKQHGRIVASHSNLGYFGNDTVVYLNIGDKEGAKPGQRYRIYRVLPPGQGVMPETIGEAVVLSVQGKSSVAMVIASYREIAAGDHIEAE